ncbi:hypothetical protein HUU62_07610 [Rhodoferax sp. 4810]|nr:hypothetical protein [Rhodoferax jenense]
MAHSASARLQTPSWRRPAEWLLMALLIVVLLMVFMRYVRQVQGQSELAAIKTTLGALRTALVIGHLQQQVLPAREPGLPLTRNPFELVKQKPGNYLWVLSKEEAALVPPGSWVYVEGCPCVGYLPLDDLWLDSPSSDPMIWFEVTGMPGVLQLVPKERYLWGGYLVD